MTGETSDSRGCQGPPQEPFKRGPQQRHPKESILALISLGSRYTPHLGLGGFLAGVMLKWALFISVWLLLPRLPPKLAAGNLLGVASILK